MKVYSNSKIGKEYFKIREVRGISCQWSYIFRKVITKQEAMESMIVDAASINADAIINASCQYYTTITWECIESYECIGDAVKFKTDTLQGLIQ